MSNAYLVYDVFTDRAFGGNQLAVIPEASQIPEGQLQQITREFGYSETVFIYPPRGDGYRRVRIFTPTMEVPFAGHPTIGTAIALHDLGGPSHMVLELGVGQIRCRIDGALAAFRTATPLELFGTPQIADVAACLGLDAGDIATATHPPTAASVGLPFCLVELTSADALARARPQMDAFRHAAATYPMPLDFAIYCYIRQGDGIDARMFAPLDDIPEDPATGSAAAALGAFLASLRKGPLEITIRQGVAMGRPSTIGVEAGPSGVQISGQAVQTMSGQLHLAQ